MKKENAKRMAPADRREQILDAAVAMAKDAGFQKITRDGIAIRAGVAMGLVTRYFGTMTQLRRAVMRSAVKNEVISVIAEGLAIGDPHAKKAGPELKARVISFISES